MFLNSFEITSTIWKRNRKNNLYALATNFYKFNKNEEIIFMKYFCIK